jgi:transposase
VVPGLTLLPETAGQRAHALREVSDGLRHVVENGIPRRAMPHDLPPWAAVHQQALRRPRAGCLATLAHDRRAVPRLATGRAEEPSAAVPDSRTLRSTPEGGHRAGRDGRKRARGSKLHVAADPPGHRPALHVTPASGGDRAAVAEPAGAVQDATGASVEPAFVDQGHTGERPADAARAHGIALEVVGLPGATRGVVVLPRRLAAALTSRRGIGQGPTGVVERSFAWRARCRRPARDHARLCRKYPPGCTWSPASPSCRDQPPTWPRSLTVSRAHCRSYCAPPCYRLYFNPASHGVGSRRLRPARPGSQAQSRAWRLQA